MCSLKRRYTLQHQRAEDTSPKMTFDLTSWVPMLFPLQQQGKCQIRALCSLAPFFSVHPSAMGDYEGVECSNPNCVVMGDAGDAFTYQSLNEAFRVLIQQQDEQRGGSAAVLVSLGYG